MHPQEDCESRSLEHVDSVSGLVGLYFETGYVIYRR